MTMMQGLSLTGVSLSATTKKRGELSLATTLSHVKVMHQLLASIYDGLETDGLYDDDFEGDAIQIGKMDAPRLVEMFADRCFKVIEILTKATQGPIELPVTQILTVLSRGLSVSYSHVLSIPSRTDITSLLPWLHQCCMDVMSQLILCCGRDILPQSHVIIDLCLQTIVSTAKMTSDARFRTRSSVYQALVLWVRSCGWGKYLTSHRKLLLQELMDDIEPDASEKLSQNGDGKKHDPAEGRKKNKKKKKRRGDSYLELETAEEKDKPAETSEDRLDTVEWAFSLSQLTVENLPFSIAQSLINRLIQTATTVQRLSQCRPEPYKHSVARENLYKALTSCLLSRLDFGCNRNDAVSHYQLTNSAVNLLHKAGRTDDWKIAKVCSQGLDGLKLSSNLNGPVIRKILEFDDSSVEDVGQLMREKEHMQDCMDDLRQKLLKSEMEGEQQTRLVSSLREQMEKLQSQLSSAREISKYAVKICDENDNVSDEEDEDDDDDLNENDTKASVEEGEEDMDEVNEEKTLDEGKPLEKDVVVGGGKDSKKNLGGISKKDDSSSSSSNGRKKEKEESGESLTLDSATRHKRTNEDVTVEKKSSKKAKIDLVDDERNDIDEMLLDFVDAPPDS